MNDIKFPVIKKAKYGITIMSDGSKKETLLGYEMWANAFTSKDGIQRILLDSKTPWTKIWENVFYTQNTGKSLDIDIYEIDKNLLENIGAWEGFVTSFIWQGIKFTDVFVQVSLGKRYFLPKILIKQIKEKIDAKLSKIDVLKDIKKDETQITWENPDIRSKDYFGVALDNFGKINK